jgi:hypothetical protein
MRATRPPGSVRSPIDVVVVAGISVLTGFESTDSSVG